MFILFDIGGSKMRVAATEVLQGFEEPIILDTPQDFDAGMKTLIEAIHTVAKGRTVQMAVGGIAGPLNKDKSCLINAPHLPEWIGKPFKVQLEEALNVSVHVENDSALVALGEANFGAGKGFTTVAYLTISTGVGGTRVVQGRLDSVTSGFEPGHQIIDMDKSSCLSCRSGSLEDHVSGTAVATRFGKQPNEITDAAVWNEIAGYLAVGVMNTILHWTPDAVVLGGSMMVKQPGINVSDVEAHLKRILTIYPTLPVLKVAELQAVGGLYGGLALLEQLQGATGEAKSA